MSTTQHNEHKMEENVNPSSDQPLLKPTTTTSSGLAMIHEEDLDEQSGYSHIYLTSVYHDDVNKLKDVLKRQFHKVSQKRIPLETYLQNDDDQSFNDEIEEINLEAAFDPDKEDLEEAGHKTKKADLFLYSLSVGLLSAIIQMSFIITLIKEYFREEHFIATDHELIAIRIFAFLTLNLKLWIEFSNGRKIVMHGVYQGFLYRDMYKRIISVFMGCVQIFTALACCFCSSQLIVQTETVVDCVKDFSALIIITEIDNWIGDYFINMSKQMRLYTREYVVQLYVLKKNEYFKYTIVDLLLDGALIATFIVSIIPIYDSIKFTSAV